jgi:hypothetical protein
VKKTVAEMVSEFLRQGALVLIAIMPLGDWLFGEPARSHGSELP